MSAENINHQSTAGGEEHAHFGERLGAGRAASEAVFAIVRSDSVSLWQWPGSVYSRCHDISGTTTALSVSNFHTHSSSQPSIAYKQQTFPILSFPRTSFTAISEHPSTASYPNNMHFTMISASLALLTLGGVMAAPAPGNNWGHSSQSGDNNNNWYHDSGDYNDEGFGFVRCVLRRLSPRTITDRAQRAKALPRPEHGEQGLHPLHSRVRRDRCRY